MVGWLLGKEDGCKLGCEEGCDDIVVGKFILLQGCLLLRSSSQRTTQILRIFFCEACFLKHKHPAEIELEQG